MHTLVFPEHAMTTKNKKNSDPSLPRWRRKRRRKVFMARSTHKKTNIQPSQWHKAKKNRNAVNLHLFQFRLSVAFLHNFLPVSADPVWAIITDSRCCEKIKVWIFMIYLWCLASRRPSHSPETVPQSQTNQLNAWLWLIFVWRLDVC